MPIHRSDWFERRLKIELDKAFQFAVILAWDDLTKTTELR
jgi:hypothetical protein